MTPEPATCECYVTIADEFSLQAMGDTVVHCPKHASVDALRRAFIVARDLCKRYALDKHAYNVSELERCGDHDICIDWRVSRDTDFKDVTAAIAAQEPQPVQEGEG